MIDSREAMPQDEPLVAQPEKQDRSTSGKSGKAAAKPRTRRPRLTFEDGSLTRVFKFPSKSYPRSTYYVTADEIVIRIKKARRRWKLVVPKNRLVSYKTNRWFAKPRWVEIELTYTQAVKLKLVEPKTAPPPIDQSLASSDTDLAAPFQAAEAYNAPVPPEPSQSHSVDHASPLEIDAECTGDVDEGESDGADDAMTISEEEAAEDPAEEWDEASAEELAADSTDASDEAEAQPDEPLQALFDSTSTSAVEPEAIAEPAEDTPVAEPEFSSGREPGAADALELPPAPHVAATETETETEQRPIQLPPATTITSVPLQPAQPGSQQRQTKQARRLDARLWASTLMLTAAATGWIAFEEWRASSMEQAIACGHRGSATACADQVATGSLGAPPQDVQLPSEPAAPVVARQQIAETAGSPPLQSEATPPPPPATPAHSDPTAEIAIGPPPVREPAAAEPPTAAAWPAASTVAMAPEPPKAATPALPSQTCSELAQSTRPLTIHFEFASSSLDQLAVARLAHLATQLRGCSSAVVTIEGHTDSDGDAERNQALSVRRANEALAYLSNAGLRAERLSAAGYGPSRPQAPNNTSENKRTNRRVTIKIDAPR